MRRFIEAWKGVVFLSVAHLSWVMLSVMLGRYGLRLASSTSEPTIHQIASQQFRDLLIPFFPAALIAGFLLGLSAKRLHSTYQAAVIGGLAAPVAFVLSLLIVTPLQTIGSSSDSQYAAEKGMAVLAYVVIAPVLGLTASPLWAVATALLSKTAKK